MTDLPGRPLVLVHSRKLVALMSLVGWVPLAAQTGEPGVIRTPAGTTIYYEKFGSGPHAVVVPNRLFMPEFRRLARADRTVILYDMRNRGRSGAVADSAQITIAGDVEDLEAVRLHFGFARMSLVGYSYLGLMVALYATARPENVQRLVQIGPVPRQFGTSYPADQVADLSTLSAEGTAAAAAWRAARDAAGPGSDQAALCRAQRRFLAFVLVGNPANHARIPDVCQYENEWFANQNRHLAAHFGDIQRRVFAKESFTALQRPVLVIHGTMDRNAPYGAGLEWATTFLDSRLVTIDGGAHQVWLDDPSVLGDIDVFLDGQWPARAVRFGRQ
jgi:pimeloyl-ACP methyl ester carboxylesterase